MSVYCKKSKVILPYLKVKSKTRLKRLYLGLSCLDDLAKWRGAEVLLAPPRCATGGRDQIILFTSHNV